MHLASDYVQPTPRAGRCRIRIYLPEEEQDAPVVICSELPNNGGTSVTYAAEQLAAEVIRSHAHERNPSSDPVAARATPAKKASASVSTVKTLSVRFIALLLWSCLLISPITVRRAVVSRCRARPRPP